VSLEPDLLYQFAGVYSFGRGVFRSLSKLGSEFSYKRLTRLDPNDFVFPKLMAWEGAFGIVPAECVGYVVSPEFPVFRVNQQRVLPEVLDFYFKTPTVWPVVSGISTGTNVRRRRLNPTRFLDYDFPLPPMPIQHKLRQVTRQLEPVRRLQAETQAELDALLPAVLDRAFRGEL
jgi:type I restriction enzyme S subunit